MRLSKKSIAGIIAALLAVAVVCGVVVWSVPVFRVSEVKVSGTKELSAEEVEEASGIHHGDNLVRVDVGEAARDVAALPWVASATVSRSFPSSVKVKLTEHTPVAFVKDDGKTRLIDDRGEDFAEGEPPVGAVEITGDTGTPDDSGEDADALHTPEMEEAVAVLAALPDDLRGQVGTLDISRSATRCGCTCATIAPSTGVRTKTTPTRRGRWRPRCSWKERRSTCLTQN